MVYWLIKMVQDQEVLGSNPSTVYWMDVSDDSYCMYIHRNNKNKGSQKGQIRKKKFKKEKYCLSI
jgi:hypothetical protein